MTHHVRLKVQPWDDRPFTSAVERVLAEIEASETAIDAPAAAEYAQHRLREDGWPLAEVAYHRSAEEALGHVAHWIVYRERPA